MPESRTRVMPSLGKPGQCAAPESVYTCSQRATRNARPSPVMTRVIPPPGTLDAGFPSVIDRRRAESSRSMPPKSVCSHTSNILDPTTACLRKRPAALCPQRRRVASFELISEYKGQALFVPVYPESALPNASIWTCAGRDSCSRAGRAREWAKTRRVWFGIRISS